jgi:hypothetical protein
MVMDQVARLNSGAVPPDKFDFSTLKFDGARWGAAALSELSQIDNISESATVRKLAAQALAMACQYCGVNRPDGTQRTVAELAARVTVYPVGRTLPASFYDSFDDASDGAMNEIEMPLCFREKAAKCTARFVSLRAGDAEAILFLDVVGGYLFEQNASGEWGKAGRLTGPVDCALVRRALEQGEFHLEPHARPDLVVGDERLTIAPLPLKCRSGPAEPSSPK